MEIIIAWFIPIIGIPLSWYSLRNKDFQSFFVLLLAAAVIAFGLTLGLILLAMITHAYCLELQLCTQSTFSSTMNCMYLFPFYIALVVGGEGRG